MRKFKYSIKSYQYSRYISVFKYRLIIDDYFFNYERKLHQRKFDNECQIFWNWTDFIDWFEKLEVKQFSLINSQFYDSILIFTYYLLLYNRANNK